MGKAFDRRAIPAGASESVWRTADGQAVRRIDWTAPAGEARGSILFLPGRGDFYEKYLETLQHWHDAGWLVSASDWRGQGGSGRLGADPFTGHIDDFASWVDDLARLWREWQADRPGPHVLAGHSMGAHLALRACAERRVDPAALLLVAPMLGFAASVLPAAVMQPLARLMTWLRGAAHPAWKWSEKPGEPPEARERLLTHDHARYSDELWWRAARPELVMGPGSWGWVERAYASMRGLSASGVLEAIPIPVLILASEHDKLVSFRATEAAAARIADCTLVRFGEESGHEILREADPVLHRAWSACDAFLAQVGE